MQPTSLARAAGLLYLVIIVTGVWSDGFARASLVIPGDAAATAANIAASPGLWRLSLAADALMVVCDVLLAAALFTLLRPAGEALSRAAMLARLTQAAVLGANLLTHATALTALDGLPGFTPEQRDGLVLLLTQAQALGYDIGLIFFGVNCILVGALLWRSAWFPSALGALIAASGPVYLIGSGLALLAPQASDAFNVAYLLPLVAESALCLWLLVFGLQRLAWPTPATA